MLTAVKSESQIFLLKVERDLSYQHNSQTEPKSNLQLNKSRSSMMPVPQRGLYIKRLDRFDAHVSQIELVLVRCGPKTEDQLAH